MARFSRLSKTLVAAAFAAAFALGVPATASAGGWDGHYRHGWWFPLPPPPPFFFPHVVVHRHGPYCGHYGYGGYGGYYRGYDRHEGYGRYHDRYDRHERHHDRYERY
jgi:hypothetical protein